MTDTSPLLLTYDIATDAVIRALITEAEADPDVIGLVLTGSRALGAVTTESDYDAAFVVTDAAFARYEATQHPARGTSVQPPISTDDLWSQAICAFRIDSMAPWNLPVWADSRVLYDRTGETTAAIEALRHIPDERAPSEIAASYDAYSLKSWRRGNVLGGRLEAAGTVEPLLHLLFALEGRWCPFRSRLPFHLPKLAPQGWAADEVANHLLDLVGTGASHRQQVFARRVVALLRKRGFHRVYESWNGQIDRALAWSFLAQADEGKEVVRHG